MSSRPAKSPPPSDLNQVDASGSEAFIEDRLQKTRCQLRGVDLTVGLLILVAGVVAYLLIAVVVDQWLLPNGLGFYGRLLLLLVLVMCGFAYFFRVVLPLCIRRISSVYAAHTIEQSQPSFKNGLINFLLMRGIRQEVSPVVFHAMEQQAAKDLSNTKIETVVDRARVIRLGYVLIGLAVVFSLYLIISPKNPFSSAARILVPWADIAAPTRVAIRDVDPGNAIVFHGQKIAVSANVSGLADSDQVLLWYTTDDRQTVNERMPMTVPDGGYAHQCTLPPGSLGLQQDLSYFITAGDCRTKKYSVQVQTAPTILVDSIEYDYPSYTGIEDRKFARQGDIRAIEGTKVTIRTKANFPIDRAEIDLDCDGLRGLEMAVDDRVAVGHLSLRMGDDDPTKSEHESYQIRFVDDFGRVNPYPIRHRIEVILDRPPQIHMIDPPPESVELAQNGSLELKVEAEDPDFGLRRVALHAERAGRSLSIRPLLDSPGSEQPHQGSFQASYRFSPKEFGLAVGDKVAYYFEAKDNREPVAGRSETPRRWITVAAPTEQQTGQRTQEGSEQSAEQQDGREPSGQSAQKDQPSNSDLDQQQVDSQQDRNGEKQSERDQPNDGQRNGEQGDEPDLQKQSEKDEFEGEQKEPVDGDANPGDAFEKILEHQQQEQEKEQEQQDQDQRGDSQQSEGGKEGQQQSDRQSGQTQESQQHKEQDQRNEGQQEKDQRGEGEQETGQKDQGQQGEGSDSQQTGIGPGDDQKGEEAGSGQQGESQEGQGKSGQGQNVQTQSEQDQQGEVQRSEGQRGDGRSGSEASGKQANGRQDVRRTGQPGEGADGQRQEGEQQGDGRIEQRKEGQADSSGSELSSRDQTESGTKQPAEQKSQSRKGESEISDSSSDQFGDQAEADGKPSKQAGDGTEVRERPDDAKGMAVDSADGDKSPEKQPGDQSVGFGEKEEDQRRSSSDSQKDQESSGRIDRDRLDGTTDGEARKNASQSPEGTDRESPGRGRDESEPTQQGPRQKTSEPDGQAIPKNKIGELPEDEKGKGSDAEEDSLGQEGDGESRSGESQDMSSRRPKSRKPGAPTTGGGPKMASDILPPDKMDEPGGDAPNLEYAKKATTLALEHLKDQIAKEKPDLLRQLGWSKDEAIRFINRWEQMDKAASQSGLAGTVARKKLEDTLRGLGLRSKGTELRGGIEPDTIQRMRESRRFEPPPGWADQFRAYTKGVADKKK